VGLLGRSLEAAEGDQCNNRDGHDVAKWILMPDQTYITADQAAEADRIFNATRSAGQVAPVDDEGLAAQHAAYIKALEDELATLEKRGNPRAEQVRDELARVRQRHLNVA
jgi:hypothetical protein